MDSRTQKALVRAGVGGSVMGGSPFRGTRSQRRTLEARARKQAKFDQAEFDRGYRIASRAIDLLEEDGDGRPVELICDLVEAMVKAHSMCPLHYGLAAALEARKAKPN